ncbi:hypothetical protein J4440_01240 [Candidatus Woesearchaeota archaeon]|nr:hypothetical protein [Candidatus Woesearchaeota archaeon]
MKTKLINFFLNSRLFLLLTFLATNFFFIYQRLNNTGWDFAVYVMNAKYLINEGLYFEVLRPLFSSFIISFYGFIFGFKAAEFLYIISIASLHLYSCYAFCKKFNFNLNIYYLLFLVPAYFILGVSIGTELLMLSLFQLYFAFYDSAFSGIFLAFSFLTRYNGMLYFPFILGKDIKLIFKKAIYFIIPIVLFGLYYYFKFGNPFISFLDNYALNVYFRDYYRQAFNFVHLIYILGPLVLFTLFYFIFNFKKIKGFDYVMILFLLITLYSYYSVPGKEARYLFNLLLPCVYFSYKFIANLKDIYKIFIIFFYILLFVLSFSSVIVFYDLIYKDYTKDSYLAAVNMTNDGCMVSSNAWVLMNYYGRDSKDAPRKELLDYEIDKGYRIVMFKFVGEPDYIKDKDFLKNKKILYENEKFFIFGDKNICKEKERVDRSYLYNLNRTYSLLYNQTLNDYGFLWKKN